LVLPTKVSKTSTQVTGIGISLIAANVDAFINVNSYSENGVARTTGGDIYYVHIQDRC